MASGLPGLCVEGRPDRIGKPRSGTGERRHQPRWLHSFLFLLFLAKRPECGSHLVGKQRWLLPGGEVSPNRDLHALDVEESELVLPVEASRRNPGIRQPVKRRVVEDVVT